jgi:hypothetical protein
MDSLQEHLEREAARLGLKLVPAAPAAQAPVLSSPLAPVDPPEMKPAWEKEIDETLAKHGGTMDIVLSSGTVIRVTPEPKHAAGDLLNGVVDVSYDTFKRLSRAAAILNAKVTNIVSLAKIDARKKQLEEQGLGYWASPHIFVEIDKQAPVARASSEFGVVAVPKTPPSHPPIFPLLWLTLSAASIVEQVPMRITGGKVIGTLIKTTNGPMYARTARDTEHKLNISTSWAMGGGYTIEREVYDKYLTDPATIIKVTRGEHVYLTTSGWIQQYGGVIKQWGSERIVMPLAGNYWLIVDKSGETVK